MRASAGIDGMDHPIRALRPPQRTDARRYADQQPADTPARPATGSLKIDRIMCAALGASDCAGSGWNTGLSEYEVTFTVVGSNGFARAVTLRHQRRRSGASGRGKRC